MHETIRIMCVALSLTLAAGTGAEQDPEVAVLLSDEGGAYEAASAGLQDQLRTTGTNARIRVYRMGGDAKKLDVALTDLAAARPAVVVPLGSLAAARAADIPTETPIVACLVLDEGGLARRPHSSAVTLQFPVALEFEWLKRVLPNARSVGVLYDPRTNAERVARAREVVGRYGLSLMAREVPRPQDLPDALEALADRVDVLWGMADPVVLTAATAKPVLTFSYSNRIPFVGLSESWVKAGALYALERDYEDIGRQCGESVAQTLEGRGPASFVALPPRKVSYTLNLRAARYMRLELPASLVSGAKRTYE